MKMTLGLSVGGKRVRLPLGIAARTVVFDVITNGGSTLTGIRSIEFKMGGVLLPQTAADFTAFGISSYGAGFTANLAFDSATSKIGLYNGNGWATGAAGMSRIGIIFNTLQTFDEIVVNNFHDSGGDFSGTRATLLVRVTGTEEVYNNTTYNAAVTGGFVIVESTWARHVSANVADDQTIWQA